MSLTDSTDLESQQKSLADIATISTGSGYHSNISYLYFALHRGTWIWATMLAASLLEADTIVGVGLSRDYHWPFA